MIVLPWALSWRNDGRSALAEDVKRVGRLSSTRSGASLISALPNARTSLPESKFHAAVGDLTQVEQVDDLCERFYGRTVAGDKATKYPGSRPVSFQ
jgi:hypothetical protein